MGPVARAAVLVLVACLFFAGMNVLAKAVGLAGGADLHPLQITFFRYLFGTLTLLPVLAWRGPAVLRTTVGWRHLQRLAFGIGGLTTLFAAIGLMPLAEATAIGWSAPLFAVLLAALFLGEKVDRARWVAAGVGFLGVIVLARPTPAAFQPAALIAVASAVLTAAEVTTMRRLATIDPPLTTTAIVNIGGTVAAGLLALPFLAWPSPAQWPLLAGIGVLAAGGQLIFIRALAMAEASAVVPFYYATLVYAGLAGVFIFGEPASLPLLAGGALIVGAGIYLAIASRGR